jgi:opacity protein-like surface antigen
MRRVVCVTALLAACVIFGTPAAAQERNGWFMNAGLGGAVGTLGSTPNLMATTGYRLGGPFAVVGEVGMLSHAPFEKAAPIGGDLQVSEPSIRSRHVNGFHYNANLLMTPGQFGRLTPYITGGFGAFTGQTVAGVRFGSFTTTRRGSETHLSSNLGGGVGYRLTDWLGANVDYRYFAVNAREREHINRFTAGVSFFFN